MARDAPPPLARPAIERLYLAYLLFAPLGATVMATVTYAGPPDFVLALLWLGGAVAVSIYAAFASTYLLAPRAWWRVLLVILDGPLWLLLAALALHGWEILDLATWFFVSEAIGIYLAIAIVAARTVPIGAAATIGIMLGCIAIVCFACGWALFPKLSGDPRAAVMFALSIVQATIAAYWIVGRDQPVRDGDQSSVAILVCLGLFHVAIGFGALLRFVVLR